MAKKKGSSGGKKSGGAREVLIVASKVKAYIKSKDLNTASESIEAISERVYELIDAAASRTAGNGRKTLKAQDL